MKDENILTGCKTNRSSFSGFVRLVPKMMNPVLMPAEWSALSKLKNRSGVHTHYWHSARTNATLKKHTSEMVHMECCAVQKDVVLKSFT